MTARLNMGAVYGNIYGGSSIPFQEWQGSAQVIWHLGDATRANAIADALQATPTLPYQSSRWWYYPCPGILPPSHWAATYPDLCSDVFDPTLCDYAGGYATVCNFTVQQLSRNGQISPYVLYQFVNIEGTHLGPSGTSAFNGSMSASYCAYAYALGGPPMQPYRYGHAESALAADEFYNFVFNTCVQGIGFFGRLLCGGDAGVCGRAGNMLLNCMINGPGACADNTETWRVAIPDPNFGAWTISPDRLGGHSRFADEVRAGNPPTTWSTDTAYHPVRWYSGGSSFGCWW